MDEAVGRIVDVLKITSHYNNSVIVFTTDVSFFLLAHVIFTYYKFKIYYLIIFLKHMNLFKRLKIV